MQKPNKILIVRTDRLGDVVLSTPVIKNLRLFFPKSHIAFICRPYVKDVLYGNPYLNEVIIYDKYNKHKSMFSTIKFAFSLKKKNFDWIIVLHPTNRAHLIAFLSGIPFRAGWNKKLGFLLNLRIPHTKQKGKKHELEYSFDILRKIGIPIKDKNTYFPIFPEVEAKIKDLLKSKEIVEGDKFIVIHPSASCPSKRWPQEKFSELISILKSKLSYPVVTVTAKGEEMFAKEIVGKNQIIDLRGKLSIAELGALLKRAALFISNDSGPVHIAASLNIPVISIFGRNNPGLSPRRWAPLGKNSFYFHKDVGCHICLAHNCQKGFICLDKISSKEVADKAISFLKG